MIKHRDVVSMDHCLTHYQLLKAFHKGSLNKANHWFSLNKMVPNAKKTKLLLLGTKQKLSYNTNPSLNLSLRGTEIKEAMNKKLLRVKIDKHLHWNSHIDYMITKLDSRINLKRARKYLNLSLRNLLYNANKTNFRILLFSVGKH